MSHPAALTSSVSVLLSAPLSVLLSAPLSATSVGITALRRMDGSDHYEILQLDSSCTVDDIRMAYKTLAKRHHPDKNPNNREVSSVHNGL